AGNRPFSPREGGGSSSPGGRCGSRRGSSAISGGYASRQHGVARNGNAERPLRLPRLDSPPVFDDLSDRLRTVLGKLTGRGRVTEADVDAAMRESGLALL